MTTPDFYPKPTDEQVARHMAEVRAALEKAREAFAQRRREDLARMVNGK